MPSPTKTAAKRSPPAAPASAAASPKTPARKTSPKPAAAKAAATDREAPGSQPSLRFYHSQALQTRTHALLTAIEAKPDAPGHGAALADLVNELIDAGMDYYFLRALQQAEVGFVALQSARLGLSGAVRLISTVSRKFIVRLEPQQLLLVAAHIRALG